MLLPKHILSVQNLIELSLSIHKLRSVLHHTLTDIFTYIIRGIDRYITDVFCLDWMPRPCSLNGKFSLSSSRLSVCVCVCVWLRIPFRSSFRWILMSWSIERLFLREMNERDMNTVLQPTQTHREREAQVYSNGTASLALSQPCPHHHKGEHITFCSGQ